MYLQSFQIRMYYFIAFLCISIAEVINIQEKILNVLSRNGFVNFIAFLCISIAEVINIQEKILNILSFNGFVNFLNKSFKCYYVRI